MTFEVRLELIGREGIPLSTDDLVYGVDDGWLAESAAVDAAAMAVARGDNDGSMLQIACLDREDRAGLGAILDELHLPGRIRDPRQSARKWLYLVLKDLYERRDDFPDALEIVEEIYADFDYPPTIEGFVRYMPLQPGDEPGVPAMMARWRQFLDAEHAALTSESPTTQG